MPRKWEPREMRMVAEYTAKFYSKNQVLTRVRLGALHPSLNIDNLDADEKAMLGVWRRWADAIVITPSKLILIEGAILADPGDISKLIIYKSLIPHTPELSNYLDRDIEMQLVYSIEDPLIVITARQVGIKTILFQPDWILEYVKQLTGRAQRASLTYPLPGTKKE
jgi:hypothetical protein